MARVKVDEIIKNFAGNESQFLKQESIPFMKETTGNNSFSTSLNDSFIFYCYIKIIC